VNGEVVRELGVRADPDRDRIDVDGRRIRRPRTPTTYVVHKPRGVVSTTRDPHAKRTVLDLVPAAEHLFPVGRLDAQSEGLLLLTNDGELAHALMHPSFEVPRTYRASVAGSVRADALRALTRGVELADGTRARAQVTVLDREEDRTRLELTLSEGRKHEIREMLRAVGHPVRRLVRVRFGPIALGTLRAGQWRALSAVETRALARLRADAQRVRSRPAARVSRKTQNLP
jgi:pseudouridine synthase